MGGRNRDLQEALNIMKLCRLMIIALFGLLLVNSFAASAQEKRWLSYDPAVVELEGRLTVQSKYGPPNYGENPKTDAKVRVPILLLTTPVNVRGNPEDKYFDKLSVAGLRQMQLIIFPIGTPYEQYVGKKVVVKGTLFHAFAGQHYTKAVMDVRSIQLKKGI